MVWIKFPLHSAPLWVSLTLQLAIPPDVLAGVQTQFQPKILNYQNHNIRQVSEDLPPPPKNPDGTAGGGSRDGGKCPQDIATSDQPLTALVPAKKLGLTMAEHPTFFVYVPQTAARVAEFGLFDKNNNGIYQKTFTLVGTPGIISFSLPTNAPPLEIGRDYKWSFAIICAPDDRLQDQLVSGSIRRTKPESALLSQLEKAAPQERVPLYEASGFWYDALSILSELLSSQPDNPNLKAAWKELLDLGELDALSAKPLRKF